MPRGIYPRNPKIVKTGNIPPETSHQDPFGDMSVDDLKHVLGAKVSSKMPPEVAGMIKEGTLSDTVRTPIQFIDTAYFDPILFFIQHRDRKELNFRLRYYYEFHPLVHNAIDLHSQFPLSDFALVCGDSHIQQWYNDYKDDIELLNLLMDILHDYWLLGEAFNYGHWDAADKCWKYFTMYPPEKITMKSTYVTPYPLLFLEVDNELKKVVQSTNDIDREITRMMDPRVAAAIQNGNKILLPNWQTSHFCKKVSRYDLRGTSIVKSVLKDLLYEDKLRLLQFTFADRHMFPLKIFKLGNPQTGWIPGRKHFEALRDLLISAANDPDFNIIFHHGLEVEYIGTKDKIAPLTPEFEFVENRILTGLFTNKAITRGESVTYANANVSVRVLMHRYLVIRDQLELMMRNKIFAPIAKARGYYKSDTAGSSGLAQVNISGKYKVLDLPKVKWQKLNLLDDTQQKNFLMQLRNKLQVPMKLMCEVFDLEYEDTKRHLRDEEGTVFDPAYDKARQAKASDEFVAEQILQGKKGDELKLTKAPKEEEEKEATPPAIPPAEEFTPVVEAPGEGEPNV